MSNPKVIRQISLAWQKQLLTMPGAIKTAFENENFEPTDGVPYQRAALLRATPENPTLGLKLTREHGLFQVVLMYPVGAGTADSEEQADRIYWYFKQLLTIIAGDLRILVTGAPRVATGFPLDGRWAIPISIPWETWVNA